MMRRAIVVGIVGVVVLSGCSSVSPPQVGQAVGGIVGTAIAPGVGTQLGSIAGMLAGMLAQGQIDKANEKHERKTLGEQMATNGPSIAGESAAPASGTPTRVWVDETVHDGRLIAGHFDTQHLQ